MEGVGREEFTLMYRTADKVWWRDCVGLAFLAFREQITEASESPI